MSFEVRELHSPFRPGTGCPSHQITNYFPPHLSVTYHLKGRVHGLAHVHESKCCFSPVYVVASTQAILFHNIVEEPIRSE